MSNLKYRLLVIVALVAASLWALFPRTVVERVNRNGVLVSDTVRRVPLRRGLDLQGGMHLALEIDDSKGAVQNESEALDRAIRVVRNRIDELGVAEPVVQKSGTDRIIVELPGVDDPERAQRVIERAAFLEFQITDETQALERSLPRLDAIAAAHLAKAAPGRPAAPAAGAAPAAAPALTELLRGAADSGSRADTARRDTTKGDTAGRDTARAAGRDNATRGVFSQAVSPGQLPGQYIVSDADYARLRTVTDLPEARAALPPGKVMRWGADSIVDAASGRVFRALYVLDARPIITGESLVDARPQSDPVEGTKVDFQLSREGGRRFETETARHIKDIMAVVLDQRVITAPQIQSAIRTNGQITLGGGALQEAQDLAIVLRAGALPAPLRVAETRAIGASLGADAVEQGIRAGLLGLGLVVAIMIGYYRFSGVLAVAGLLFYALTTLAFLAGFDATLTLPGIAGFILSIGMAVDANFLQFERIREELDKGRSVRSAVEEGFRHSFAAIVDSHMTTALTALVLYQFGTGPVRGFAVTLLAGVASSMVSAVFVVRTLFIAWLKQRPSETRTLSI
jgi:preprotein translocase subunit SecD